MQTLDFEYDGVCLSGYGYSLANIAVGRTSTFQVITNGSQITFNTVPFRYGEYTKSVGHTYPEVLKTTLQICPNPCFSGDIIDIDDTQIRELSKWLNREQFHRLRLLNEDFLNLNFNAVINMSKIMFGTKTIGFSLDVITDSPFAYGEKQILTYSNEEPNWRFGFPNLSDKEGIHYPKVTVKVLQDGDLNIINESESHVCTVKNCVANEEIVMDYPLITSSVPEHKIQNDFNWNYMRLVNEYKKQRNNFFISLPCEITIEYTPYVKLAF